MMTSIEGVAAYEPPEVVSSGSCLAELGAGKQAGLYERFYGFSQVRRAPQATIADLMYAAAAGLGELHGREDQVRYVVHAATLQPSAPYPRSPVHEVCRALGLDRATAFALGQHACASGLLALDLCGKLLAADRDPAGLALILVGEKTFSPVTQVIPHSAITGEGTAAVLVGLAGERDRMLGYAARTYGEFDTAPFWAPELAAKFQRVYAPALAEVIMAAVSGAGLTIGDIALILPHNVNRMSWHQVAEAIGLPRERILLSSQPSLGHCFGADSFINYKAACQGGLLRPGDCYIMSAAGLGATFAAMVFRH